MTEAMVKAIEGVTDLLDHEEWEPQYTGPWALLYHRGGDRRIRIGPDGRVQHQKLIHMGDRCVPVWVRTAPLAGW